ncbi:hypothetical protein IMZ38_03155 [Thermosphaera chiliense]|mgnify:CR=1 FL=1|uniref:Uncharacterized protein n=1 Tax=Thermosphaera chiliense TaxID=3402707 RepID=A0A7M1URL9_9CREN|nr:hypothetical protein [Thermosphaera aggregans]QOR94918.1 hypothetical protein IMZ38_03155 [Thermosphaera aggregans]
MSSMEETLTRITQPINNTRLQDWVEGLDPFSYIALLIVFTVFITLTILEFKQEGIRSALLDQRDSPVK